MESYSKIVVNLKECLRSDTIGIYQVKDMGLVIMDKVIQIQLRSQKKQSLSLRQALRKIGELQEELQPADNIDHFSISSILKVM